ncbi:hypothetical protein Cabys_3426 [Caldithrix abyssi DSM 13497]|uniref:Uncharacterized protein n=1 Tax=Caldithrix abyssi DSM 13497 TaxID=880073 RepID=A0A1J1CCQ9_CALAY|nr:hypothetical protein Cabys_3426 [Caldithrix abyssi DSM 13497]
MIAYKKKEKGKKIIFIGFFTFHYFGFLFIICFFIICF